MEMRDRFTDMREVDLQVQSKFLMCRATELWRYVVICVVYVRNIAIYAIALPIPVS